jgi:hypothetical protein
MKKTVKLIECDIYSRVVGYFRPLNSWNIGKVKEFGERNLLTLQTEYTKKNINYTPIPIAASGE